MTLRESVQLKLIQTAGWEVRFCWSERPYFEARKGTIKLIGFNAEELFDLWSNRPEVIGEVFGIDVKNFVSPEVVTHEELVDEGG